MSTIAKSISIPPELHLRVLELTGSCDETVSSVIVAALLQSLPLFEESPHIIKILRDNSKNNDKSE
jgi:hypothetical protein